MIVMVMVLAYCFGLIERVPFQIRNSLFKDFYAFLAIPDEEVTRGTEKIPHLTSEMMMIHAKENYFTVACSSLGLSTYIAAAALLIMLGLVFSQRHSELLQKILLSVAFFVPTSVFLQISCSAFRS
jgi:hypothetical protein